MSPEFKDVYELAPSKMTEEEFKIATVGLLNSIVERLDITNGKVKVVGKHEVYFKIIGAVIVCVVFPVLVVLLVKLFS